MSRLDSKVFELKFGNGRFSATKEGQTFFGSKTGNFYTCIMHAEKPLSSHFLNLVQTLPVKIWYDCVGHLNWEALKAVKSNNPPLLGIKFDTSPPPLNTCEGCTAGKAKCCAFKPSSSHTSQSTKPIE